MDLDESAIVEYEIERQKWNQENESRTTSTTNNSKPGVFYR